MLNILLVLSNCNGMELLRRQKGKPYETLLDCC